jgi:hypothetical protein
MTLPTITQIQVSRFPNTPAHPRCILRASNPRRFNILSPDSFCKFAWYADLKCLFSSDWTSSTHASMLSRIARNGFVILSSAISYSLPARATTLASRSSLFLRSALYFSSQLSLLSSIAEVFGVDKCVFIPARWRSRLDSRYGKRAFPFVKVSSVVSSTTRVRNKFRIAGGCLMILHQ